jgi:hypothetical protein
MKYDVEMMCVKGERLYQKRTTKAADRLRLDVDACDASDSVRTMV